ncbi:MAG TPA: SdpI family protein [Actinophytocola sp.]|uniref:SdpI family protein n=1 Tax=Actinophytocola sp. TaxID=1872138 RepID=UPI002DBB861A|nr:SdpI family protein [Actinophytocola sp.]HEU5473107.1 SdpI family protein [Actinophytocola sp.]
MSVLAILPVSTGLAVAVVGLLGSRQRLSRNRFVGVRTAASMRSDAAFRLANRVAGPPTVVAGLVGVLAGVAALLVPGTAAVLACVLLGLAGMIGIATGAGVLGHRAALAVPEPEPARPAGCSGCACGNCVLTSSSRS